MLDFVSLKKKPPCQHSWLLGHLKAFLLPIIFLGPVTIKFRKPRNVFNLHDKQILKFIPLFERQENFLDNGSSITERAKYFFLRHHVQTNLRYRSFFLPRNEADHSCPESADKSNAWSCTYIPQSFFTIIVLNHQARVYTWQRSPV